MYNSSDQLYTGNSYLENNPDWHQEGSGFKAGLIKSFIERFKIPTDLVVEVGCGAGEILVELGKHLPATARLQGFDISSHAIELARKKETAQLQFFLDDYSKKETGAADLVLLIDVAEHIDDVYSFLRRLRSRGDNFIFHIPLDMSCRTLLKPHTLLQQRNSVGHIHYFTEETTLWMLRDVGYEVKHFIYTKPDIDLKKPATLKAWTKKMLRKFSYTVSPKLSVKLWGNYSLLIFAKPILK